jgi:hypothetical protein
VVSTVTVVTVQLVDIPIEYFAICRAVAIGFAVMGFIGYIVKLIHIPVRCPLVHNVGCS